ncbi:RagB/SusD family nutrient uptake outer membrane protein [Arenibacter palladensis]|uniref:RagB/SusD family nutrient uptake outer membrane protein n=1 Tax=Arenibacter palladensis TaxID=237373 RepID=UPI0026E33FBF|nr:RagB/SusD family nutrient uptake outer membrane protein [Arenibacter palladensis]MDO6602827.1 RagB/SusD family nutrient uptake outer membrane protein [Arenibacter palladensis]
MQIKNILIFGLGFLFILTSLSCENELEFLPGDRITSASFPKDESDIVLLLNGCYAQLRETSIYNQGLFGFGVLDGATPNAYNWGNTTIAKAGNGQLSSSDGEMLTFRWTRSYSIIFRTNYLIGVIDNVELDQTLKSTILGEVHFLRGLAYATLAVSYGGVPILNGVLTSEDASKAPRATLEETWSQAISDYDIAIKNLGVDAAEPGRATKGAALGMKMRAFLYQGKYTEVLNITDQIDELGKYGLFASYEGLFRLENENNNEVLFDVQYISGENSQGTYHDQFCGTGTGSFTRGTRYVPTDNLVETYEMVDGSEPNLLNTYEGRDPRLGFTIVVPGSTILEHQFPSYLFPGGAFNHPGNRLKHLSARKYRIESLDKLPPAGQSNLNYIVLRYADVILAKAEALIETNGNLGEAINLINRIRTERDDVKITPLPMDLSREEAREKLRHERRVEFALEGLYWFDINRWGIGRDIYPVEVRDHNGDLIETKFPGGYLEHYKLLPIPESELSLNEALNQNPGW